MLPRGQFFPTRVEICPHLKPRAYACDAGDRLSIVSGQGEDVKKIVRILFGYERGRVGAVSRGLAGVIKAVSRPVVGSRITSRSGYRRGTCHLRWGNRREFRGGFLLRLCRQRSARIRVARAGRRCR